LVVGQSLPKALARVQIPAGAVSEFHERKNTGIELEKEPNVSEVPDRSSNPGWRSADRDERELQGLKQ
ncbi:MAG: hypothetical protein SV760_01715, partial [Halobacteria archaeon]|nr:hypothetical protein [Halobacteria archaeon]